MGASEDDTMTLSRFLELFPSSDACLDYLKERFHPDGATCPKCRKQTKFHRLKSRPAYSCQYCGHQVYPTSGTIFERSTTSLQLWFWADLSRLVHPRQDPRQAVAARDRRHVQDGLENVARDSGLARRSGLGRFSDRGRVRSAPVAAWRGSSRPSRDRGGSRPRYGRGPGAYGSCPWASSGAFVRASERDHRVRAGPRPSSSRGRRPGWRGPSRARCPRPCSRRTGPPGRRRPRC